MTQKLTPPDRVHLTNLLAGLFSGLDAGGRRNFLLLPGLDQFTDGINFAGDAQSVAAGVLAKLEPYGELPTWPGYTALGALLWYLLTLNDLPPNQLKGIARLIGFYELISDASYLSELQARFPDMALVHTPAGQGPVGEAPADAINMKELLDALLSAFGEAELARMVRLQMNKNLAAIAGGANLTDITFNLIQWAERTGRLRELLVAAYAANKGNAKLKALAQKHKLEGI